MWMFFRWGRWRIKLWSLAMPIWVTLDSLFPFKIQNGKSSNFFKWREIYKNSRNKLERSLNLKALQMTPIPKSDTFVLMFFLFLRKSIRKKPMAVLATCAHLSTYEKSRETVFMFLLFFKALASSSKCSSSSKSRLFLFVDWDLVGNLEFLWELTWVSECGACGKTRFASWGLLRCFWESQNCRLEEFHR